LVLIERIGAGRLDEAFAIVREYYDAVGVSVREDADRFAKEYFRERSGLWLASEGAQTLGCIALRPLPQFPQSGEVKRLYVLPQWRGRGVAELLLTGLEAFAREIGYRALYLDTKDDLTAAIRFYRRHGYEPCERYNENPQATMFMRKDLPLDKK